MTLVLAFVLALTCSGIAAPVTFNNTYSGSYQQSGFHFNSVTNYSSGQSFGGQYNNFFIFDLTGLNGTLSSATFNVFTYGVTASGTYTIYATSLSPSIANDCFGCTGIWAALTSGTAIGSIALNPNNSGSFVAIALNSAGLGWLQANEGNMIVLGGQFPQAAFGNYAFGYSGFTPGNNLTIDSQVVPEPGAILLLGTSLLGVAGAVRRRLM